MTDHLVGAQQKLTWTTQRQITFTSTFQNAITTLTLGFPPSSVSSCTVTRITTLGFFSRAFAHSRSIISAFSTSVSRRCMNTLHYKRRSSSRRLVPRRPCAIRTERERKLAISNVPHREPNRSSERFAEGWRYPHHADCRPRSLRPSKKSMCRVRKGAAMSRILSELLLFSCLAALVTGIVLAAATLLS